MYLEDRISRLQKGSDFVADYLLSLRSTADTLAAIDQPIGDEDLVLTALRGLGPDFRDFATSIRLHAESVSFVELADLLLSHESFLRSISDEASSTITTANVASTASFASQWSDSSQRSSSSGGGRRSFARHSSRYRGNGLRSRYGDQNTSNWKQYPTYSGQNFRQRSGQDFQSGKQNSVGSMQGPSYQGSRSSFPTQSTSCCQICNQAGHTASHCPQRFNHAFLDMGNLALCSPFSGPEQIVVGNGQGIRGRGRSYTKARVTMDFMSSLPHSTISVHLLNLIQQFLHVLVHGIIGWGIPLPELFEVFLLSFIFRYPVPHSHPAMLVNALKVIVYHLLFLPLLVQLL